MPVPHRSVFTGRMLFLPPNRHRQSTEGKSKRRYLLVNLLQDGGFKPAVGARQLAGGLLQGVNDASESSVLRVLLRLITLLL